MLAAKSEEDKGNNMKASAKKPDVYSREYLIYYMQWGLGKNPS